MSRPSRCDPKLETLRKAGTVNRRPEAVIDASFQEESFFDARDVLQVKYEMLRRVRLEGSSVKTAAAAFGFSRVAFYQARKRFEESGVAGLLPKPRGPKRAHKLKGDVVAFLEEALREDPSLRARALAGRVGERFGLTVHPRSIERALARRRKRGA